MKKLLFIINTMGCGGAERAMLNLFSRLDPNQYEISLFVITGQGELRRELPENVRLINKKYKEVSVLTKKGRRLLTLSVLKAGIGKALFLRRAPYLIKNFFIMLKKGKILLDKLFFKHFCPEMCYKSLTMCLKFEVYSKTKYAVGTGK